MATFEPCPSCQRHVKIDEVSCPFCASDLSEPFARLKARAMPRTRLGRAALFAFGVGATSTALTTSCASDDGDDDEQTDGGPEDGDESDDGDQSGDEDGTVQPVYGAPPPDAGQPNANDDDAGGVVALYGGAPTD